jgi:succinyl-diaminopimelate desuccinylase
MRFGEIENLYARIGTNSPNLCFAGHTEVVPPGDIAAWSWPPFEASLEDGVLIGRGSVDMKSAVAAFICAAARVLAGGRPPGRFRCLSPATKRASPKMGPGRSWRRWPRRA